MKTADPKTTTRPYWLTWLALMLLLFATWGVAQFNFGVANTVLALLISGAKLALVMIIFMQLRDHPRITWVFASAGLIWLLIMITMTLSDYLTRKGIPPQVVAPASVGFR
jgi:cytochrome c oxidase subunit 4